MPVNPAVIVPTVTIQAIVNPNVPQGTQLISIGGGLLRYTGTVIMYDPQFPLQSSVSPGISIPFFSDESATVNFTAPVVYIRNTDQAAVMALTFWQPTQAGGSTQVSSPFALAPGGFFLFFNPSNPRVPAISNNPGGVGLGASPNGSATLNITNATNLPANAVIYAEILIAA